MLFVYISDLLENRICIKILAKFVVQFVRFVDYLDFQYFLKKYYKCRIIIIAQRESVLPLAYLWMSFSVPVAGPWIFLVLEKDFVNCKIHETKIHRIARKHRSIELQIIQCYDRIFWSSYTEWYDSLSLISTAEMCGIEVFSSTSGHFFFNGLSHSPMKLGLGHFMVVAYPDGGWATSATFFWLRYRVMVLHIYSLEWLVR